MPSFAAGMEDITPVHDQFDGDRRGALIDPFGHMWLLATMKEDVLPEERQRIEQGAAKLGGYQPI